jgi:hypothetical protein
VYIDSSASTARKIFWEKHRREIFWDLDGSITGWPEGAYLSPYKPHFEGLSECEIRNDTAWNSSVVCHKDKIQIRDVLVNNPQP